MLREKHIICVCLWALFCSSAAMSQVPVKNEPRHHPVLQNKYIRLLDVWLPPGDTTLYHIHETPSVFVILSHTITGAQIKGENWVKAEPALGNIWYRSFSPDILVHRVCNMDSVVFHVNDIEIVSFYDRIHAEDYQPLPFPIVFNNERAVAYRVTKATALGSTITCGRPLVIELVTGDGIIYNDIAGRKSTTIAAGKYLYINPGTTFQLTSSSGDDINLVIFEIK